MVVKYIVALTNFHALGMVMKIDSTLWSLDDMPKVKKVFPRTYMTPNDELLTELRNGNSTRDKRNISGESTKEVYGQDGRLESIYSVEAYRKDAQD